MINPHPAHVAARLRGKGQGVPIPPDVHAEAVRRLSAGEKTADVRRWLWSEHELTVSTTTLEKWRARWRT